MRQALESEAKGLDTERLTHLARAIALDPGNALARGLMGLVEYRGRWRRPEAVGASLHEDAAQAKRIREYLARRAQTPARADAQVKLAEWCEQNGLKEQAQAHYRAALRQEPSKDLAWRRLGYKKQGNRWAKLEDLAAEKAEAETQKKADRAWKPRLEKIRDGLLAKDPARHERAEKDLATIRDPRAMPTVRAVLLVGNERLQLASVRALGQIEGADASCMLADLAVLGGSAEVRDAAAAALLRRDPREVVGRLIGLVRRPLRYKVVPGEGPGSVARLKVDAEQFDLEKAYLFPGYVAQAMPTAVPVVQTTNVTGQPDQIFQGPMSPPSPSLLMTGNPTNGDLLREAYERSMSVIAAENAAAQQAAELEANRRSAIVQRSLDDDVRTLEDLNARIGDRNARVLPVLRSLTGQDLGAAPDAWTRWWVDQLGYASSSQPPKPVYTDMVSMPEVVTPIQMPVPVVFQVPSHMACFAAGTPVHTIDGPRPIEAVQVGDLVLAQDTDASTLSFRPVTAVHRNEPSATLRLRIDGETIIATGIHRFWKAGQGWVMARDLRPGDRLRRVGATSLVESVEPDVIRPIFNLDVEADRTFFVGDKGILVHDFSLVQPVDTPFDGVRPATVADSH